MKSSGVAMDAVNSEGPTDDILKGLETISVLEAGRLLGLKKGAAYAAAKRGEIPAVRFGGKLRVPVQRLRRALGV